MEYKTSKLQPNSLLITNIKVTGSSFFTFLSWGITGRKRKPGLLSSFIRTKWNQLDCIQMEDISTGFLYKNVLRKLSLLTEKKFLHNSLDADPWYLDHRSWKCRDTVTPWKDKRAPFWMIYGVRIFIRDRAIPLGKSQASLPSCKPTRSLSRSSKCSCRSESKTVRTTN